MGEREREKEKERGSPTGLIEGGVMAGGSNLQPPPLQEVGCVGGGLEGGRIPQPSDDGF